jgi:hypothetical protein
MAIDVQKLSVQINYILSEHSECQSKCLGQRKLDLEQHQNYVANIIAYFALGMEN